MPCQPPRILSEHLTPLPEPLACLLTPGGVEAPAAVAALGARALLDLAPLADGAGPPWPGWLAPHQVPAAERLAALLSRYGGAVLADAVGLGKSYVSLAVALRCGEPFALVVPAVLVDQWRALLAQRRCDAPLITHEALSAGSCRTTALPPLRLLLVDEAHRFRNPTTKRYRALARLAVGMRLLLVTATAVHNRIGDLCHLLRLFLRDHDLTAFGVPSLSHAARGEVDPHAITAAAARLCVARSRARARAGYAAGPAPLAFPEHTAGGTIRIGVASDTILEALVEGIGRLDAGGDAAPLFRLLLLSQLASSRLAFRASLARYEAFLDISAAAQAQGRVLDRRDFKRAFPAAQEDLQLALLPLLLPAGSGVTSGGGDRETVRRLRELAGPADDPKADALARILGERAGKTIVFVQPRATVRHLLRRLRALRVAAVVGDGGWFGLERATQGDVLRAFAPLAQRGPAPPPALETDVLLATDLLSEGLNLQDAIRVIHYDVPWSPARLTQRVGRIDRAGSLHACIETVTFLPPEPLAAALALERRWVAKRCAQSQAGADGFDWCDRLQAVALRRETATARAGSCTAVAASQRAVVLVIRLAGHVEAVVVTADGPRADPVRAAELLELAAGAEAVPLDRTALDQAIRRAAPLVRNRLAALAAARWRAADRDRLSRRLIPWVLTAARRAATRRRHGELGRLDALVSRLALGMTAGEELRLEDLITRRAALSVSDVLAWHDGLPPVGDSAEGVVPPVELVAGLVFG